MNNTDIELYHPNPSVAEVFSINESLPENEKTFDILQKLVLAIKTHDVLFLSIGKMLKYIHDNKLYKNLDFDNFSQFLSSEEIAFSREKAYMYMRVWEHYCVYLQLSEERMKELSVTKLAIMLPKLKSIQSKEEQIQEIDRMNSLRYGDFIGEVKKASQNERPNVIYSEEREKWVVYYFEDTTELINKGVSTDAQD